jgi:hypothetical protein
MYLGFIVNVVTLDGGSPITSYAIEMDSGSGFVPIIGDPVNQLSLTYTHSSGILSGQTYSLRYRVRNIYGFSTGYSPVVQILAATIPDSPASITTANSADNVLISWIAPVNTGGTGVLITAYKIEILKKDGVTYAISSSCDGSLAGIVAALQCTVPMS